MFERPLIAIDIGSSSVKVAELAGVGRNKLVSMGLELVPNDSVSDGFVRDEDAIITAVKTLFKKLKIKPFARRAALSLGGSSVLIKKVSVDKTGSDQDINEIAYYEAEQHFQHDLADLYLHHHEFTTSIRNSKGLSSLVLVGARREIVEQYISITRAVGLRVGVIDCDIFAIYNVLEKNFGVIDDVTAIVNIGAATTQVVLVASGEYLFSHDIQIGGDTYTQKLMDVLGVEHENAETIKLAASQNPGEVTGEVHAVLDELNSSLSSEVRTIVDFFLSSDESPVQASGVSQIFLSGGGSKTLGLPESMAQVFQTQIQILNPFQNIKINEKKFQNDYITEQGHLHSVSIGLACRRTNDANK